MTFLRPFPITSRNNPLNTLNGLLLRRDLHRLFDIGYVTVTPDYVFRVSDRLRADFKNGRSYYELDKTRIEVPTQEVWLPSKEHLAWHGEVMFKK